MGNPFVEELMNHIMETRMIPKVQVERAVGPILNVFLADVLTATFSHDPNRAGKNVVICPEFPFKKPDNNQSTNIDWLMYNPEQKELLFVELKTSDTSVNVQQTAFYRAKQKEIREQGGAILIQDLEAIRDASSEYGKYQFIMEEKILPFKKDIYLCHDACIVYLVPESAVHKVKKYADIVLTFGGLSNTIEGPYSEEWRIIQRHLCVLDTSSQQSRNRKIAPNKTSSNRINFSEKCSFDEIMMLCKQHGNDIIVGFMGGVNQLTSRDFKSLQIRQYKWDQAFGGKGKKNMSNWINGGTFYRLIKNKESYESTSPSRKKPQQVKWSKKWQGTFKFDDMVAHCNKHGNDIIIGFSGGKTSFAKSSIEYLQQRPHYKWDYAENLSGKNRSDWIPGGWVIKKLKEYHGHNNKQ